MENVNHENQKRIDTAIADGVAVGEIYAVRHDRGRGSQCVYTDAGEFYTVPGVPGSMFSPDAGARPPFRGRPA